MPSGQSGKILQSLVTHIEISKDLISVAIFMHVKLNSQFCVNLSLVWSIIEKYYMWFKFVRKINLNNIDHSFMTYIERICLMCSLACIEKYIQHFQ